MNNYLTPFTFENGVELRNRFVMAPMTTYSANPDDTVSEEELAYYEERSHGVGAVITACTYVSANGKGFSGQFAGHTDAYLDSLQQVAQAIHKGGAKAILQIYHGGVQSPPELVPNGDVVSASDIPDDSVTTSDAPVAVQNKARALTVEEIQEIVQAFGETTRRAIEAGFDGVEIHGANTYLLQQFFSGWTNKRTDQYGGTVEKRMRFPLEVVAEVNRVKQQYADDTFILGYRFSPEEREEEGFTLNDTVQLVDRLAEASLDYLHVSLKNFRSFARRYTGGKENRITVLRRAIAGRVPLIGVGSIYSKEDALEAVETDAELLALGRELLIEPHWVDKVRNNEALITEMDMTKDNVIPGPMMRVMQSRPGWVPGVE